MTTQDTFEFALSSPIKIQSVKDGKNQFINQGIIYLTAPTQKQMRGSLKLRQSFMRSFNSFLSLANNKNSKQDTIEDKEDKEDKAQDNLIPVKEIITILNFGDQDLEGFYNIFYDFIESNNVVFVDKSLNNVFNSNYLDKLSFKDYELLAATYIQVFFTQYWV
jgi:hypothetical protein